MQNKIRKVLYISKYALTPANTFCTRQFFLAKGLSNENYETILVSSVSCGHPINVKDYSNVRGLFFLKNYDKLTHHLISGIKIDLGFNFKRIFSWLQFEWRLYKHLKKVEIDKYDVIIISSLSLMTILNGIYWKKKKQCKLIFEVRDIWPLTLIEIGGMHKWNPFILFLSWIEKLGYQNADLIIGTMPGLHIHVRSILQKDFRFLNLPMGFEETFFLKLAERDETQKPKVTTNDKFVVSYAGAIGRVNRVQDILEAAKILEEQGVNIRFQIIGDGPLKNVLHDRYVYLTNVTFIPWLSKVDLFDFLSNSHLLLHPVPNEPIYRFGVSPNKWIDYMYSGRPILISYEGHYTILEEANCAIRIEPEDPVALADKILVLKNTSPEFLNELGKNGKDYLQNRLSYKELCNELIRNIESLYV
jgi:glycosyltransferase involved in cell wall biosynthesis